MTTCPAARAVLTSSASSGFGSDWSLQDHDLGRLDGLALEGPTPDPASVPLDQEFGDYVGLVTAPSRECFGRESDPVLTDARQGKAPIRFGHSPLKFVCVEEDSH